MWKSLVSILSILLVAHTAIVSAQCNGNGLLATYYGGMNFSSLLTTKYEAPNFNWAANGPGAPVPATNFSAVWTGYVTPLVSGLYTFAVTSDDGFRLYLNGSLISSYWTIHSVNTTLATPRNLTAFVSYPITLHYFQASGLAQIGLGWYAPGASLAAIPFSQLSTVPCNSYSIFMTQGVIFSESVGVASLIVAPTSPPNSTVIITLSSSCFLFSQCTITYDQNTWSQQVTVKFYNQVTSSPSGNQTCVIYAVANSTDPRYNNKTANSTVTKINSPSSTAITFGDPHLTTFDGNKFDFYYVGDYYFIRQTNSEFVIQTRQTVCSTASCNSATAIKFRTTIFYVYLTPGSGTPSTSLIGSPSSDGVTITTSGGRYTFNTITGINVTVTISYWQAKNIYHLGVAVAVKNTLAGLLYGLAGYYDGIATNDYTMPNGTTTTNTNGFGLSWKVNSNAENMFLTVTPVIPTLFSASTNSSYAPRLDCTPGTTAGSDITDLLKNTTSGAPYTNVSNPFPPNYTPNATVSNQTAAKLICDKYFNGSDASYCNSIGLNGNSYYKSCMTDYGLTQDVQFAIADAYAYYQDCQTLSAKLNGTFKPCPNLCSGQGNCTNNTCSCTFPWTAADCSVNSTATPNTTDAIPSSMGINCQQTITVAGTGFVSSPLYCWFNNTAVLANIISQYQVTCQVPPTVSNVTTKVSVIVKTANNRTLTSTGATFTYYRSCCQSPCLNGGTCNSITNGYTCTCDVDYNGTDCQNRIDFCASSPCLNGGNCSNAHGTFNCSCPQGYNGTRCQNSDQCKNSPCQNGGTCINSLTYYNCSCLPGYFGFNCQNVTNNCLPNPCASWSTCVNSPTYYNCTCPPFASGQNCTDFPTVPSSSCASISLDSSCYDFSSDTTAFCYNVTTGPYGPPCNISSIIFGSDCNATTLVSSAPSGAYFTNSDPSGVTGWRWDYPQRFGKTAFFCLDFRGFISEGTVNYYTQLNPSLSGTVAGPLCSLS